MQIKQSIKQVIVATLVCLVVYLAYLVTAPQTHYGLGNVFFGQNPALYNVNFSQYFFRYAAYPLIGDAPVYAHYQLSRTYFIQGRFEDSIREAKVELELHPDNYRTYYILGLTYGYMSREIEAIEAFSKFIEKVPSSWAARNDKAWLQFRVGDIEGALETIEPASSMNNPWVQNTYGTLLLNDGQMQEAKKAFTLALELASNMTEEDWGKAYPGNDPRIHGLGLSAMKKSITENLSLIEE